MELLKQNRYWLDKILNRKSSFLQVFFFFSFYFEIDLELCIMKHQVTNLFISLIKQEKPFFSISILDVFHSFQIALPTNSRKHSLSSQ